MPDTIQSTTTATSRRTSSSRGWAVAGVVAAAASAASVFLSMMLSPGYEPGSVITPEIIDAGLAAKRPLMIAFHVVTLTSALLLVVFAAGLHRRLRQSLAHDSLAPSVAGTGLLLVVVAQVLGTGLDTEFLFGVGDTAINLPSDIGMYSHWIATIPWLWVGAGLSALAVGAAARHGAAPRWIGVISSVLGVLTVIIALSPLQYMAALLGVVWLFVVSVGFVAGDRAHRLPVPGTSA